MRNDQRNVSDYRHERTDTVSAVGDDGQRPAMRDGEAPEEDRRAIGELEQLAHLLQELHATMNSTLDSVASAQQDHPAEAMIADTPPASGPAPEPSPAPMRRTGVILSVGGAAVLLGLLGWVWRGTPASDPGAMQSAELTLTVPVDGAAALPASAAQAGSEAMPRMALEDVNATTDEPPATAEIAAAPAGANDRAIPEAVKASPRPSLVDGEPLRGVAGEPIPLGIVPPQTAISKDLSVAVEGVRFPATLTSGTRLGGDTWIVGARQADAVALLTPATFPGGRMEMGVRLVSNDGRITEANRLTVSIEPPPAPAAPTEQAVSNAATVMASESSLAAVGAARPVAPSDGEGAESLTTAEMIEAQMMADAPPLQPGEEGQAPDAAGSPPQGAGIAAAPLDVSSADITAHASPEAPQSVGNAAHIVAAQEAAAAQDEAGVEPGATQTPSPAVDSGKPPEPTRTEPVSTHVNMRAGPSNDAAVVTVVPAGRRVGVIACDQWCEVTYADKRGWIHSRFVGEAPAPARPAAAQAPSKRPRVAAREARRRAPADNAAQGAATVASAPVTADVHMRAKPDDDSAVVAVVAGGSKVRVLECRQWCEVAFAGKRGWINARYVGKISAQKRESGGSKVGGWLKKLSPF